MRNFFLVTALLLLASGEKASAQCGLDQTINRLFTRENGLRTQIRSIEAQLKRTLDQRDKLHETVEADLTPRFKGEAYETYNPRVMHSRCTVESETAHVEDAEEVLATLRASLRGAEQDIRLIQETARSESAASCNAAARARQQENQLVLQIRSTERELNHLIRKRNQLHDQIPDDLSARFKAADEYEPFAAPQQHASCDAEVEESHVAAAQEFLAELRREVPKANADIRLVQSKM